MFGWDLELERGCHRLVIEACDGRRSVAEREAAWKALLVRIAPFVEGWARGSPVLRRCRLTSDDEVRAVLVGTIARLGDRDFDGLRRYLARQARPEEDEEARAVEHLVRIARDDDDAPGRAGEGEDAREDTPLRGYLVRVVRFAAADHVRDRLGWSGRNATGVALTRRDVATDAARMDDVDERGARPPITDLVTLKRVLEEIRAYAATFPPAMTSALELWLEDESFDAIASRLSLEGPDQARALSRAAIARLRDRFRGSWPELSSA